MQKGSLAVALSVAAGFSLTSGCAAAVGAVGLALPESQATLVFAEIPRVYRVVLQVTDVDAGEDFYRELLQVQARRITPGRSELLISGPLALTLLDPRVEGETKPARPNAEGLSSIVPPPVCFLVHDIERVHDRAQLLAIREIDRQIARDKKTGERSFGLTDPFGNSLCFVDATTTFSAW